MSRYGSVSITGAGSLITRVVQSSVASDLQQRVNAAIAALPVGYVVVDITLAGAGQGATFTVTIEAGAAADVSGGFAAAPSVACFMAADAGALLQTCAAAGPPSGEVFADTQVVGASGGTVFMGMVVIGVVNGAAGSGAVRRWYWVDTQTIVPGPQQIGAQTLPFKILQQAVDAAVAAGLGASGSVHIFYAGPGGGTLEWPAFDNTTLEIEGTSGLWNLPGITVAGGTGVKILLREVGLQNFEVPTGAGPVPGDLIVTSGEPWIRAQSGGLISPTLRVSNVHTVAEDGTSAWRLRLSGVELDQDIQGSQISLSECVSTDESTIRAVQGAQIRDCWIQGDIDTGSHDVDPDDQGFVELVTSTLQSSQIKGRGGLVSLVGCEVLEQIGFVTDNPVELDTYSDARATAMACTFSSGSTVIG